MTETWVPIAGYEGRYEVSTGGGVWSVTKNRPVTPYTLSVGYLAVGLWDGKSHSTRYVHDLVARAFGPEPEKGQEVRHLDGDPLNNAAKNLRWGSRSENTRDAVRHGTHHQAAKTHCKRGHEFTPDNTRLNPRGHRRCITCARLTQNAYYSRKKANA